MNTETPVCAKCYSNGEDDPGKDWQQMAYLPRAAWTDEDTYLSDAPAAMFDKTIVWCSTPCAVGYFMDVAVRLVQEAEETRRETARGVEATARAARNAGERARQAAYATRDAIRRRELP